MKIDSLLRKEEHRVLSAVDLYGKVIDLGGDKNSYYQKLFSGDFDITTLNLNEDSRPDIFHDLEQTLPVLNESYDGALLINVLEHIFEYRQLLEESVRILKPGGLLVIAVPFMFPVHPSPHDFRRFTAETLELECKRLNLKDIEVTALGTGVFSAVFLMLDRLMPTPVRFVGQPVALLAVAADKLFGLLANMIGKKYLPSDYALGYVVTAKK